LALRLRSLLHPRAWSRRSILHQTIIFCINKSLAATTSLPKVHTTPAFTQCLSQIHGPPNPLIVIERVLRVLIDGLSIAPWVLPFVKGLGIVLQQAKDLALPLTIVPCRRRGTMATTRSSSLVEHPPSILVSPSLYRRRSTLSQINGRLKLSPMRTWFVV